MPTKKPSAVETERLREIFRAAHARIAGTSAPEIEASFYPFAGLKHIARLGQGKILVKISDIFADAPAQVLEATARLLLSKLYRKRLDKKQVDLYRLYVTSEKVLDRIREARRERGRAPSGSARGRTYDLAEIFDRLNRAYFSGRLAVKVICWSRRPNRRQLGRYDAAHDAIVISRHLDSRAFSRRLVEFVVYHEMLHKVHAPQGRAGRRFAHHEAFRADERKFRGFQAAQRELAKLGFCKARR